MTKKHKDNKRTRNRRQASSGFKRMEQASLLPEPDFNPKVPQKNTLSHDAISLMLNGKEVSHRNFDKVTSSYRLAAVINDLKKDGWIIESYWFAQRIRKNRKRKTRYKKYYLKDKYITLFLKNGGVL